MTKTPIEARRFAADPATDAGWLVDTPWLGHRAAVFGATKDDALAQAEARRATHIAELQAQIEKWRHYELRARFVEAIIDD